jgi:hypothetical protein
MFKCEACGGVSAPNEMSSVWVSRRRKRQYALLDKHGNRIGTSVGWEIVKEMRLCSGCHEEAVKADEYKTKQQPEAEPDGGSTA